MHYVLDTDSIIFLSKYVKQRGSATIQAQGKAVFENIKLAHDAGHELAITSMTEAELLLGVNLCADPAKELAVVSSIIAPFKVHDFTSNSAIFYGSLRADLRKAGNEPNGEDMIIAATVLAQGSTLVTHNIKDFGRIPDLKIEDWTTN